MSDHLKAHMLDQSGGDDESGASVSRALSFSSLNVRLYPVEFVENPAIALLRIENSNERKLFATTAHALNSE